MGRYDDIIHLPHPTSTRHPRMPIADRAAQFAPFAALTGYDSAIKETARLTDEWVALDENAKAELDLKLRYLLDQLPNPPEAVFTYFEPDSKKDGGAYVSKSGIIKRIDPIEHKVILRDGSIIPIEFIVEIETPAFEP